MGILTDEMQRVVREQRLGYMATVCPDGTANLSPKGTLADADHLMFADIRSPGTVANLRANPSIEINVVDTFRRAGYCLPGVAVALTEGAIPEEALRCYEELGTTDPRGRFRAIVLVRSSAPRRSPPCLRSGPERGGRARFLARLLEPSLLPRPVPGSDQP
ncbi:MAG: pyridoxamine 5'-phosphate oxidase family protein [Dehalococcoidia bacterium]